MTVAEVEVVEPDRRLRGELQKLCTADDGLVFADVRWWPEGRCLAIMELRQNRRDWIVRDGLRDEHGRPRQVHEGDVRRTAQALHEARHAFDNRWYDREVVEHNERVNAQARADFHDEIGQIGKMSREMESRGYCWHGSRPAHCETCIQGSRMASEERQAKQRARRRSRSRGGLRVTDHRRVFG